MTHDGRCMKHREIHDTCRLMSCPQIGKEAWPQREGTFKKRSVFIPQKEVNDASARRGRTASGDSICKDEHGSIDQCSFVIYLTLKYIFSSPFIWRILQFLLLTDKGGREGLQTPIFG